MALQERERDITRRRRRRRRTWTDGRKWEDVTYQTQACDVNEMRNIMW